mgnify:CR=1 FL=1
MIELESPLAQAYAIKIQGIVNELKKTSKKAIAEANKYLVDNDTAKREYGGRVGEQFYLFPNEAPSHEIIDEYEKTKPYFGVGENAVTFEEHLSHRQMTIIFKDNDLIIRRDRQLYIDKLTEKCLNERIKYAKDHYNIDWNNAKIFIFPYKTIYFYISDSFETTLAGGRSDLRNPDNWFTIPYSETIDYRELRKKCREYEQEHPLPERYMY